MKTLFLHGWTSTPGVRKPSYLMDGRFTQVEQDREVTGMHERVDAEVARWEQEFK